MQQLPLPDARQQAKDAIRANPSLLKDCLVTEDILVKLMIKYHTRCQDFLNENKPEINVIKQYLKSLNNLV